MPNTKAKYPEKTTPVEEQETTVTLIRNDPLARVYTCDRVMITRLDGLCERDPEHCKVERVDDYGKWYILSKKCVRFVTGSHKARRPLTEEELEQRREQMQRIRAARMAAVAEGFENDYEKTDGNASRR